MTAAAVRPPFVYFGGKQVIADRIAALLPEHLHYVEPFCGSLAVLLSKKPSRMETVNDLDQEVMTFWRMLRDRPEDLERACALTPHSRAEYLEVLHAEPVEEELEVARRVWVRLTQGRAGQLRRTTGWPPPPQRHPPPVPAPAAQHSPLRRGLRPAALRGLHPPPDRRTPTDAPQHRRRRLPPGRGVRRPHPRPEDRVIRIPGIDHIPAVIGDLRAMNRLTQRALAEAVGTKQGRISEFETGRILPATPTLFAIAHALGYDLALVPREDA